MTTQLSVGQILSLTSDQRAQFVKQNLSNEDGTLNIENITGWEHVSQVKRDLLAQQLLTAVHKTTAPSVGPVDPAYLAALLARIPSNRERRTKTIYPSPSRSSTAEPPEDATQAYETKCHQALLSHGCRPLFPISLLPQVSTTADAYHDLLRPWTIYPDTPCSHDWEVFSRQLRRWEEFQKWQLGNRRQAVGFPAYLAEKCREFERMGAAAKITAQPGFEQTVRHQWEVEYGHGQPQREDHGNDDDDAEPAFSRYAEAVRRLLMDHGFVQPFQLLADPKQQDQWTTYIEYLAFECSYLDRLAVAAQKLQQPPSDAQKYQAAKAEADHQQCRLDWVRSEISKIEAEQMAAGNSSSRLGRTRSRKRRLVDDADDVDGVEPRAAKRRLRDETEKMVAGSNDNSRTTRSKKCKLPADENPPEPQLEIKKVAGESDGPGSRSKKRQKGTHEENGSAAPGSVLQSGLGAAVVSAVTTHVRPRRQSKRIGGERLGRLRPRVDGKVASAHGLKT